jgi:hypothetical protein
MISAGHIPSQRTRPSTRIFRSGNGIHADDPAPVQVPSSPDHRLCKVAFHDAKAVQLPDYSQVCRRQAGIKIKPINASKAVKDGVDLVMDLTGLKVYGDGEWMTGKYGPSKRRTWQKLHIGIDVNSGEIVHAE